jgi:CheY-like chemotaxis protein
LGIQAMRTNSRSLAVWLRLAAVFIVLCGLALAAWIWPLRTAVNFDFDEFAAWLAAYRHSWYAPPAVVFAFVVKQSGGFIWVYSEPGHGTTFRIYFPRVETPESAAAARITDEKLTEASEVVLVVEDDATVLDVTRRYLARAGYTVLSASNGEEAIALCRDSAPELLITDVVMPGMNGPALAEHLRRGHLNLKVLFLSGYAEAAISGRRLLPSGANFLQKPFAPKALAKKVRAIIDQSA